MNPLNQRKKIKRKKTCLSVSRSLSPRIPMIAANSASEFGSLPLRIGDIDAARSGGIDTPLMLGCSPLDGGSLPVVDALFDALPREEAREPDSFGEVVDAEALDAAAARCCACCNCLLATVSRLFFTGEGPQTCLLR